MSKKYEIDGKQYQFNYKKFGELVDNRAKEQECRKIWIYKEIAQYLHWNIDDNVNKIYRWSRGLNAPVDITIVKDVSDFFGVDFSQLLMIKEKGNIKMNNENKEGIVAPLKKYQQEELLKVKEAILDYVYDNYTSAFWEDYILSEYGFGIEGESLSFRLMERKNVSFNADIYFSAEELQQIDEERLLEGEILKNSKNKKRPDVPLLDEYRVLCDNGKMYELMRKIERSLSVLPFNIVGSIIQMIVNILPNGRDYLNELSAFDGMVGKHYNSFDDVLEPHYVYDFNVENDLNDDEVRRDSTYNTVMNIHKQLNELISEYCD